MNDKFVVEINIRDEKIKEFFRFMAIDNFFCLDTKEEIETTKNIWCKYAYDLLNDKIEGKELKVNEEQFLNKYFLDYLFKTDNTNLENQIKAYYIKYRMSSDFEYNKIIDKNINLRSELYAKGRDEFTLTLKLLVSLMYSKNENSKEDIEAILNLISDANISLAYLEYISYDYDINAFLNLIKDATITYQTSKLNIVKKKDISEKALIYTVEDYLERKTKSGTKIAKLYSQLYQTLIENKQMAIDGMNEAYNELNNLKENINSLIYKDVDTKIDEFVKQFNQEAASMEHFKDNNDNSATIYKLYLNALKAMPRSKVNNVTKYFAINGEALSVIEMNSIIEGYKLRINKEKNEFEKQKIQEKLNSITEVIDYVKTHSNIYLIEENLINQENPLNDKIIELITNNYGDYQDMKYKLNRLYENLDNIAGSGSPTKVNGILYKKNKVSEILDKCKIIDDYFLENKELYNKVNLTQEDSDIVIKNVRNYNKAIAILQELTGKGIVTCKALLDESIKNGVPLIRDLDENLNTFIYSVLDNKGAKRAKK